MKNKKAKIILVIIILVIIQSTLLYLYFKDDIKISNNTINLKDNGYAEGNIKILYCQNHTFNDYNIYLDNNTILSDINKIQYFIFMQGTKDTKQQTIFCNNNSCQKSYMRILYHRL